MGKVESKDEARNVLECLSPTLCRAIVAIAICDIRTSKDLAKVLGMSVRNAQRVLVTLEKVKAVKIVNYGKQKIICSLNQHYEREVLESVKLLLPLITKHYPALKITEYYREITIELARMLGLNSKPKDSIFNMVKRILSNGLESKPVPHWLKRIVNAEEVHGICIANDSAKKPHVLFLYTPDAEVDGVATS